MKALTVQQPWAWAIAAGGKDVENRTWQPRHTGPLAIHAGMRTDPDAVFSRPLIAAQERWRGGAQPLGVPTWQTYQGHVLAIVRLEGAHHANHCDGGCSAWAMPGQWHWELADPEPLEQPVQAKGRLGLWDWERP